MNNKVIYFHDRTAIDGIQSDVDRLIVSYQCTGVRYCYGGVASAALMDVRFVINSIINHHQFL